MFTNLPFAKGNTVDAFGQIGRIVDVLGNNERIIVCVQFVHNLGNSRPYDMVDITPERMKGVDQWQPCEHERFNVAAVELATKLLAEVQE